MALSRVERILILAKTYPSPSAQYIETSCVAGITDKGCMRRLYPVPFRLIENTQKFKKWQWVNVRIEKASKDRRPESHKIYVDTLDCGHQVDTRHEWAERREWVSKVPSFDSFAAMDIARNEDGLSLAILRPARIIALDITAARHTNWTDGEREKLTQQQMELFSETEARREVKELRKVPFDFYYRYMCNTPDGCVEYRHKIVDWEAGALFWNCRQTYGPDWETPFREKLEAELPGKDLMFLMGNLHRFQEQWLIVSLIYPPKLAQEPSAQGALF